VTTVSRPPWPRWL